MLLYIYNSPVKFLEAVDKRILSVSFSQLTFVSCPIKKSSGIVKAMDPRSSLVEAAEKKGNFSALRRIAYLG